MVTPAAAPAAVPLVPTSLVTSPIAPTPPAAPHAPTPTVTTAAPASPAASTAVTAPATPVPAQGASSVAVDLTASTPVSEMLPDNQLGDSQLNPPSCRGSPMPTQIDASPSPQPMDFKPVTAEGMKAFWSTLRRKSTDELSVAQPSPQTRVLGTDMSPAAASAATPSTHDAQSVQPSAETASPPTPVITETPPAPTSAGDVLTPVAPAEATPPPQSGTAPPGPVAATPAPPVRTAEDDEDIKEAKAAYMRFYRSVRSKKAPPAVSKKFVEASANKSGRLMRALFSEYIESNEDWLNSALVLNESQEDREVTGGRWNWLTRGDLMKKYHNNSAIVQELINGKVIAGKWKEHPEFPGNADMKLYHCWMEDFEVQENRHSRSVSHIRETMADSYNGTQRAPNSGDGGVPGNQGNPGNNGQPRVPKPEKEKTDEQLARAAIVKVNANLLEITQWSFKLTSAGVAEVVATAFVSQMESEEKNLRDAKQAQETALSLGQPLKDVTKMLDDANTQYRTASVQIRKHATAPKPKAKGKAKAKAGAAANGTA